jgi:DNA-directed RNA polymerase subunit alpha
MINLDKFKVSVVEEDESFAKVEIGPLPRGYGHTIANSLRRILLSSIPGSAVIGVKVKGVKHEYTSLAGVKDDVLKVLLNIKQLAVISHSDEVQVLKLNVKGTKGKATVVKASDIELTGEVELKNPDLEITTLADEKASIDAEIYVNSGVGYAFPDESMRKEIGLIPLDAKYSPVVRVLPKILPARVGQMTDLDKISLDIYTNKTVTGIDALLKAAEIYDEIANRLVDLLGGDSLLAEQQIHEEATMTEEKPKILIGDLGLSTRLTNSLLNSGITDLNELDGKNIEEILDFKGMGKKSLSELIEVMQEHDLNLEQE